MSNPEIALITASKMPKPDLDTPLLVEELAQLGVRAEIMAWDQPVNWASIPLIVLRTPWDYTKRFEPFRQWLARVHQQTKLVNTDEIVRWNAHKSYLKDLSDRGVPIVPTVFLKTGQTDVVSEVGRFWTMGELIAKPAISSGARGILKAAGDDPALIQHITTLLNDVDVLVQPFVPDVPRNGEVSLVYFDGKFSHSIRKQPAKGDFRVQDLYGGTIHPHKPLASELAVGTAALAAAPGSTIYARVDLVNWEGNPVVMELELIEPELFLRFSPEGLKRFALALKRSRST